MSLVTVELYMFRTSKGEVVPVHTLQAYRETADRSTTAFLTSALNEGEWSATHPGRFVDEEGSPLSVRIE